MIPLAAARLTSTAALLALSAGSALSARSLAVIMGIPDFLQDPTAPAVKFADHDAELFYRRIAAKFEAASIAPGGLTGIFAVGKGAGMFSAGAAINQALFQARPADTVFLFLSTRGIARPGAQDGYIGLSDLVVQKKESTAVRLSYILKVIEQSPADRVIIFADLCREPTADAFDNRINVLLSEMSGTATKPVAGILATSSRQLSKEDANLTADGIKGYGVFGYYLVNSAIKPGEGIALAELFKNLTTSMPQGWQRSQRPRQFRNEAAAASPLWRVANAFGFPSPRRQFGRRLLIASAAWSPFPWDEAQGDESQIAEVQRQLDDPHPILHPRALVEAVRTLEPNPSVSSRLRMRAAGRLGDQGQVCVSRFGVQDLLPDDPLRVLPADFALCAEALGASGDLLPADPRFEADRKMLRMRELFCRFQARATTGFELQQYAAANPDYVIAEVHDSLGVFAMNSRQPGRLTRARRYFEAARQSSPEWLYPRHNLALLYADQGDMRSAEREYRDALLLSHPQPYVYYNYGLILERLNRPSDARREFLKAIAAYDESVAALTARAADWSKDYPEDSDLASRRATVFRKAKAEVYNALGSVLEQKRKTGDALRMYEEASRWDPSLCPPVYNVARLAPGLLPGPAALEDVGRRLEASLQRCGQFTPSRLLLGALDVRRNRLSDARAQFLAILSYDPANRAALLGLSNVEQVAGNSGAALEWLEKVVGEMGKSDAAAGGGGRLAVLGGAPTELSLYRLLAERYRDAGRSRECRLTYDLAVASTAGKSPKRDVQGILRLCGAGL